MQSTRTIQAREKLSPRTASVIALGSALLAIAAVALAPAPSAAEVGARPAAFDLSAVPGGPNEASFDLEDHLGKKPVIVVFWATWCAPCRQELPFYQRLYDRYHEQGLEVVAISMDGPDTVAGAGPIARRLELTFPVVSDLDTAVTGRMNPRRAAPFSVWIDHRGLIQQENEGFTLAERENLARGVASLMRDYRRAQQAAQKTKAKTKSR